MKFSNQNLVQRPENDPVIVPTYKENAKTSEKIYCRDPYILLYGGWYYLYHRADGERIACRVSDDLENWSDSVTVFAPPADFHGTKDLFWAPECHYYNGAFYIFTSVHSSLTGHRSISVYRANNPLGPFEDIAGGCITPKDWDAIDGTLYVDADGAPWMVFVHEWTCMPDGVGTMVAAKFSDDLTHFVSEPMELFRADAMAGAVMGVTDGAYLFQTENGGLQMIWSNFTKNGYVIAVAKSESGTIHGPWVQRDHLLYEKGMRPEFATDGGHAMIFQDKNGQALLSMHGPNATSEEDFEHIQIWKIIEKDGTIEIGSQLK